MARKNEGSETLKLLGKRLRELRGRKRQAEMAEILGIPPERANYISRYEKGTHAPRLDFLVRVAEKFGVTLDWLIIGRGPRSSPTAESHLVMGEKLEPAEIPKPARRVIDLLEEAPELEPIIDAFLQGLAAKIKAKRGRKKSKDD